MVKPVGGLDGLAHPQVARHDDVFPAEREEQGAPHGPRAYPRNRDELCHELVVGQAAWDGDQLIVISAFYDSALQRQQIGLA